MSINDERSLIPGGAEGLSEVTPGEGDDVGLAAACGGEGGGGYGEGTC